MSYDSTEDTKKHKNRVKELMLEFCEELKSSKIIHFQNANLFVETLSTRAEVHDNSKLESPEKETFDEFTPKLKNSTYGSSEYKNFLKEMDVALKHHYENNSHHPEHYENGVLGMNLLDLVEMFFDWKCASERHADGDIFKSIEINTDRFNLSLPIVALYQNQAYKNGYTDKEELEVCDVPIYFDLIEIINVFFGWLKFYPDKKLEDIFTESNDPMLIAILNNTKTYLDNLVENLIMEE